MKHLVVDISGHGFGHLAQIIPTLKEITTIKPDIKITIRSSLNEDLLRSRITSKFDYISTELDNGMIMHDAMQVNAEESYHWYKGIHENYQKQLDRQIKELTILKPDLLLADIPYISIDAASSIGVPSIALCSLNWADIFYTFCKQKLKSYEIYHQILAAYNKANLFLQPTPSMEMPSIKNGRVIGPISQRGNKHNLSTYINAKKHGHFVLVSLGGLATNLGADLLPVIKNVNWIVPNSISSDREDTFPQSLFPLPYIDLLSSIDLILTKTGYGALVEAVTHQIPILCIKRPDWPEEPNLFNWCRQYGYFESVSLQQLTEENFTQQVQSMLKTKWEKPIIQIDGASQVADIVSEYLN